MIATAPGEAVHTRQLGALRVGTNLAIGLELASALSRLAAEDRLTRARAERHVRRLATALGVSSDVIAPVLYLEALREPGLLALPPDEAVAAQLRILMAFAPIEQASLWSAEPSARIRCMFYVGDLAPTRRMRARARDVLQQPDAVLVSPNGSIHAVPVVRWERTFGALVIKARPEDRDRALALAEELARTLVAVLERQTLLERSAEQERSLIESSERRLARFGFDLHDGPLQELTALAADLRLFRRQLSHVAADHADGGLLLGRIDDLEARLAELDHDLRDLTRSAESAARMSKSFSDLLTDELRALAGRRKIVTQLRVRGDVDSMTPSQRIALLRLTQEALTNVREHSGARHVSVRVSIRRTHVEAEVTDDGRGFDVERTLLHAARKGRLGLVGMNERIRMLGGRFDVQSSRGGPTTVSAMIPRWRPLERSTRPDVHSTRETAVSAVG
jgi:signal transduction histidine kinase